MSPKWMMIMGAIVGITCLIVTVIGAIPSGGTLFSVFAGGALFGKGYGIWEERNKGK